MFFPRVQLGAFGRRRDQGDVGRDLQTAGLIEEDRGVRAQRDLCGYLDEMEIHRLGVASRHDGRRAFALLRANCAEM